MSTTPRGRRITLVGAAALLAIAGLAGCSDDAADKVADAASSAAAAAESAASAAASELAEAQASASAAVSESVAASASAAATTTSGDFCADYAAVQASADAVANTKILEEGTNVLKERLATYKADSEALVASAQSEFAVQTAAVKASIALLEGSIAGLADDPTLAEATMIKPALEAVKVSTDELIAAIQGAC